MNPRDIANHDQTVAAAVNDNDNDNDNALQIDMGFLVEEQKYDDLLEELLSDDVDPSPKTDLLDMESPSPTFQRFWATAASADDDDDDDEYYPHVQEDIENLSKLMDNLSSRGEKRMDNGKNNGVSPMQFGYTSGGSTGRRTPGQNINDPPSPTFSPSYKIGPAILPKPPSVNDVPESERAPFEVIDHENFNPTTESRYPRRRVSTGCIPESPPTNWHQQQQQNANNSSGMVVLKQHDPNYDQRRNSGQFDVDECAKELMQEGDYHSGSDHRDYHSGDHPEIQPSATTSTEASHWTEETNGDDVLLAYSVDSLDLKPSASSSTNNSSPKGDPYEWAYNVWKRKGLMAGTPTSQRKPRGFSEQMVPGIDTNPSTESSSSQPSKKIQSTNGSRSDMIFNKQSTRIRKPKDRQSLPTNMTSSRQVSSYATSPKPKNRNGAGFSILLSRWQDKSDGNPNAHFLSPRELSPVRSTQAATTGGPLMRSPQAAKAVLGSPQRGTSGAYQQQQQQTYTASIDTTSVLSPSRRQEMHKKQSKKQSAKVEVQASSIDEKKSEKLTPALLTKQSEKLAPKVPSKQSDKLATVLLSPVKEKTSDNSSSAPKSEKSATAMPAKQSEKLETVALPTKESNMDTSNAPKAAKQSEKLTTAALPAKGSEPEDAVPVVHASIDTTPVLSPSRRRKSLGAVDQKKAKYSKLQQQPQQDALHPWPTPSKNKNALARFLQRPNSKPTPIKQPTVQSYGEKSRDSYNKRNEVDTSMQASQKGRHNLAVEITPASNRNERPSRQSDVSPTSTVPFLSPGDDTLLEPKDVMRHRRLRSDNTHSSRNTNRTPVSLSVPCKEIFVMKDDQVSIGLQSDIMSMTGESECHQSVDPSQRLHFTNLHDILETGRVDSMSFDSQSQVTHITFRTETLVNLDKKLNEIKQTTTPSESNSKTQTLDVDTSVGDVQEEITETPCRENLIAEMGEMTGATPEYSDRPWRKDLLVKNVTTVMQKASGSNFECDCDYSLAMFSAKDEMVDFFLPLMAVTCSCRKSKKLVNPEDPSSLENILRPWQIQFLKNFGITKGDQLVKAHHRSARSLAKSLFSWRQNNDMTSFRVGSCGMALSIWANTCKAYIRSIRQQLAQGKDPMERPNTLSVLSTFLEKMPAQMHQSLPQRPTTDSDIPDSTKVEI